MYTYVKKQLFHQFVEENTISKIVYFDNFFEFVQKVSEVEHFESFLRMKFPVYDTMRHQLVSQQQ